VNLLLLLCVTEINKNFQRHFTARPKKAIGPLDHLISILTKAKYTQDTILW